jgi:hypothetical protein
MSPGSKKEYTETIKYAIRLMNSKSPPKNKDNLSKRGRKKIYTDPFCLYNKLR